MRQGRPMEDCTLCALDLRIPFPGKVGIKEVTVGVVAVFDGHNGAEASDMASKLLLEYFVWHTYFLIDASGSLRDGKEHYTVSRRHDWDGLLDGHELDVGRFNVDDSSHFEILKEALVRTIHDIDVKFSKEASRKNLESSSTATVTLLADGQILVANVGDLKAFLCSQKFQSQAEAKVKELMRDHHPDRHDERVRVETAGGYVLEWGGVHRVNGELAISRAIGDVSFKRLADPNCK